MVQDIEGVVVHALHLEIEQQALAAEGEIGLETDAGAGHRVGLGGGAERGLCIRAVRQPEGVAVACYPAEDRELHLALIDFRGVGRKLSSIRPENVVDSQLGRRLGGSGGGKTRQYDRRDSSSLHVLLLGWGNTRLHAKSMPCDFVSLTAPARRFRSCRCAGWRMQPR